MRWSTTERVESAVAEQALDTLTGGGASVAATTCALGLSSSVAPQPARHTATSASASAPAARARRRRAPFEPPALERATARRLSTSLNIAGHLKYPLIARRGRSRADAALTSPM